jgi:prepilin-type N-terminal cleavage/methylation domain-containing protein
MLRKRQTGIARPRSKRGFTLAECLVASVVLAASVTAIFSALNSGQKQMSDSSLAKLATGLGEEMMERILALPYTDPNNGMASYNGYSEAAGTVKDANGNLLPSNYQVFSLSVSALSSTQTVSALGGSIAGLQINVTVKDGRGRPWTVSRFVAAGAHTLLNH